MVAQAEHVAVIITPLVELVRLWGPRIGGCLLLQASIAAGGVLLNHVMLPEPPCCAPPLEL
jgi:hypothetical protein